MAAQHSMPSPPQRLDWIDVTKALAILLVVLVHSMHLLSRLGLPTHDALWDFIAFTGPMRMPGFFLISGLFAYRLATKPRGYLTRHRVLNFGYLFTIWVILGSLAELLLVPWVGDDAVTKTNLVDHVLRLELPLWYLIALPVFYLVYWVTRNLPAAVPLAISGVLWLCFDAGVLQLPGAWDTTGYRGILTYLFFFLLGARGSNLIRSAMARVGLLSGLAVVISYWMFAEYLPDAPGASLLAVPAMLVVARGLAETPLRGWLLIIGRRTLPIFLLHWWVMAAWVGAALRLDLTHTSTIQFWTPVVTVALTIASIAIIWRYTNRFKWLYAMPAGFADFLLSAANWRAGVTQDRVPNPELVRLPSTL